MRVATLIVAAFILTGCAAPPPAVIPPPRTSAALAFDPPLTIYQPPIDLSRDHRGEAAFVGFDEPATSVYSIFTDNRQGSDGSDDYQRETYSGRFGVIHR